MASNAFPIEIIRGAAFEVDLILKDNDGTVIDLTGGKVIFAVKRKEDTKLFYDSDDAFALLKIEQLTHTFPLLGKTTITALDSETNLEPGHYVYGIKFVPASGNSQPSGIAPFIVKPRGVEGE